MLQDFRAGLRFIAARPLFSLTSIAVLALGIGLNIAMFTVINCVLLRPLPYPNASRLFLIRSKNARGVRALSSLESAAYRRRTRSFERIAAYRYSYANLSGRGEPAVVYRADVTADFWAVLQAPVLLGRTFPSAPGQGGGGNLVFLSYALWAGRFKANPGIVGSVVEVDGVPYTISGVVPAGRGYPSRADLWTLARSDFETRRIGIAEVVGRLAPGITSQQAQAEAEVISRQIEAEDPKAESGQAIVLTPLLERVVSRARASLMVLSGASFLVLIIACANVTTLLLIRGLGRVNDLAIRAALGAGRLHLVRQLVAESLTLSLLGGIVAFVLALVAVPTLVSVVPRDNLPRIAEIAVDYRALLFAVFLSAVIGFAISFAPAVQLSSASISNSLRAASLGSCRQVHLADFAVAVEIALISLLLAGALLFLKSFHRLLLVHPGFQTDGVLTMTIMPPRERREYDVQRFCGEVLARLSQTRLFESVSLANWLPFGGASLSASFAAEGQPNSFDELVATRMTVSPEYFRTMGIRVLAGRSFNPSDTKAGPNLVLISRSVARRVWPNQNPIGKRVTFEAGATARDWLIVAGVVDDVRQLDLADPPDMTIYQPYTQVSNPVLLSHVVFVARARSLSPATEALMRQQVRAVDREQPIFAIATLDSLINGSLAERRFRMVLLTAFVIVAIAVATTGIHGTVALWAQRRRRDIAVRMALGASPRAIAALGVHRIATLLVVGLACGHCCVLLVAPAFAETLFQVKPHDPAVLALSVCIVAAVTVLAGVVPILQAARTDPIRELRGVG